MYYRFEQSVVITGRSTSLLQNYSFQLAKMALHFNLVPTDVETEDVNDYLYLLIKRQTTPSESLFKFIVYSLRYMYRLYGLEDKLIALPKLKREKKLPVILSREEVIRLIAAAGSTKHRVLFLLLYGCGLRCEEARSVKINDLDFDRRMLHVRNGKGGKQRYVPLSQILMDAIVEYLREDHRGEYLLGRAYTYKRQDADPRFSGRAGGLAIHNACKRAAIKKRVSAHTLRHTYATHLLEDGLDIVSIKELLGHSNIETTMLYLHVAQCDRYRAFSPLDTLYRTRIHFSNFPGLASQISPLQKNMFLAEYN